MGRGRGFPTVQSAELFEIYCGLLLASDPCVDAWVEVEATVQLAEL